MKIMSKYKFITTSIVGACLIYTTHVYAFGDVFKAITDVVMDGIASTGNADISSPPLKDRLSGIVEQDKVKFSSTDKVLFGSKQFKLAIVKSINVDEQIKTYKASVDKRNKGIKGYASSPQPLLDELNTFVPGEVYFEKAVGHVKEKFGSTVYANSVQDAINQGADYVAVIDLKLENTDLSSKTAPGPLTERNVADLSVIFIDKSYEAGPDIVVKNTSQETFQPTEPNQNIRNNLDILKRARQKTFDEFKAKLNKQIIEEADDPPVVGTRLSLGDSAPDEKPINNKKNKK